MTIPAGYAKLPAGTRCRCPRLWEEGGEFYCCKGAGVSNIEVLRVEIAKLELKPGEVLVVKVPARVLVDLDWLLPWGRERGIDILVVTDDVELSVVEMSLKNPLR